jgi:hypothetical protein
MQTLLFNNKVHRVIRIEQMQTQLFSNEELGVQTKTFPQPREA